MAKIYKFAVNDNVRAAKLFFDVVGSLASQELGKTFIKNQNNYIQINGMVLSQEIVMSLKPEQITQIEGILKAALPETQEVSRS